MSDMQRLQGDIETALHYVEEGINNSQRKNPLYKDKYRQGKAEALRMVLAWVKGYVSVENQPDDDTFIFVVRTEDNARYDYDAQVVWASHSAFDIGHMAHVKFAEYPPDTLIKVSLKWEDGPNFKLKAMEVITEHELAVLKG